MITGSVHSLTPELVQSMQDYRAQLIANRTSQDQPAMAPPAANSTPESPSTETPESPPVVTGEPASREPTLQEQVLSASQDSRDAAREAAVLASQVNHAHNLVETYANAASSDEDSAEAMSIDPRNIYEATLAYYQRTDLIKAFKEAQYADQETFHINLLA